MKELEIIELQEINGGGFEEGRDAGYKFGKALIGATTLIGLYLLLF
jgi:hypothetical protein